jgi:hypothetical protein
MVTFRGVLGDVRRPRRNLQSYSGGFMMAIMSTYVALLLLLAPVASGARFNSVSHIDQQQVKRYNILSSEGFCA